jgi:hypothetical protein
VSGSGELLLVMEFMEGGNLYKAIRHPTNPVNWWHR